MAASAWLKESILSRCVYKCSLRFFTNALCGLANLSDV